MTLFYAMLKPVTYTFRLWFPLKIIHRERIPRHGPVMVYANHRIWYDVVPVAHATRRQIYFISKVENFKVPFFAWLLKQLGCFPVRRDSADMPAFRKAFGVLRDNKVLGIFPEGTRNRTDTRFQDFHEGAAMFALGTGAVVVPIYLSEFRAFRRSHIMVGKPLDLSAYEGKRANKAAMEAVTQQMFDALVEIADECEAAK